jgi:hypothetical protein
VIGLLGAHQPDSPDRLLLHQPHGFQVVRLEFGSVDDHQLALRVARRSDHPLAIGTQKSQRLFAQYVLPGRKAADRPLGMQAGRQDDVHRIDALVGRDLLECIVGMACVSWNAIGIAYTTQLVRISRYNCSDMRARSACANRGIIWLSA